MLINNEQVSYYLSNAAYPDPDSFISHMALHMLTFCANTKHGVRCKWLFLGQIGNVENNIVCDLSVLMQRLINAVL